MQAFKAGEGNIVTIHKWTSAQLGNAFKRKVVGYDLRAPVHSLLTEPVGMAMGRVIRIDKIEWRPATIETEVWPRVLGADREQECNGLNFLPSLKQAREAAEGVRDACVVALELPAVLLESISATFGLSPETVTFVGKDSQWELLGYDVVDIRTQTSGFYSFEWTRAEWLEMASSHDPWLNRHGLLDAESEAIEHALAFDSRVSSHAPFAPCAVWCLK